MLFGKLTFAFPIMGGVTPPDTTPPTVVITSTASTITNAAFTCTFTLSEVSVNFALGDITVGNGSAGTFAGSGTSYTAVITPTATGTVTVDVAQGAFTDAAGNGNTAATQFSILYVNAAAWFDFSDITTLYQTNDTSTPVTADGQTIGYVSDKSGNSGRQLVQATANLRPIYKVNIQNSLSAGQGDGTKTIKTGAFTECVQPNTTFIVVKNSGPTNGVFHDGISGTKRSQVYDTGTTKIAWYAGTAKTTTTDDVSSSVLYDAIWNGASSLLYKNGAQIDSSDVGTNGLTGTTLFSDNGTSGKLTGYIMEFFMFNAALGTAARQAIENYLSVKWGLGF